MKRQSTQRKTKKSTTKSRQNKRGVRAKSTATRTRGIKKKASTKGGAFRGVARAARSRGKTIAGMAEGIGEAVGRVAKAVMPALKLGAKNDATKLLTQDHKKVKTLFASYKALKTGNGRAKSKLFDQIDQELDVHTQIEEEIFYPAVETCGERGRDLIAEAKEEHAEVKTLLQELRGEQVGSRDFEAKMKVMMESVLHHASEEEREMFPFVKEELGDELESLAHELDARKNELLQKSARRKAI